MLRGAFCAAFVSVISAAVSLAVLKSSGLIPGNRPDRFVYPLKGAYISESTGTVLWDELAREGADFCYIRATKGTSFADRKAEHNLKGAAEAGILFGLVHDLDFAADGKAQADNLLAVMKTGERRLVPALDVRMTLFERIRFRDKSLTARRINDFAGRIKERTGAGVILFCDRYSYEYLDIGNALATVWADCDDGGCFSKEPLMLSYAETEMTASADSEHGKYFLLAAKEILQKSGQNL